MSSIQIKFNGTPTEAHTFLREFNRFERDHADKILSGLVTDPTVRMLGSELVVTFPTMTVAGADLLLGVYVAATAEPEPDLEFDDGDCGMPAKFADMMKDNQTCPHNNETLTDDGATVKCLDCGREFDNGDEDGDEEDSPRADVMPGRPWTSTLGMTTRWDEDGRIALSACHCWDYQRGSAKVYGGHQWASDYECSGRMVELFSMQSKQRIGILCESHFNGYPG